MTTHTCFDIPVALAHLAAVDPVMAVLAERHPPESAFFEPDLFRSLVGAIVNQQLSAKAGDAIMRRLIAAVAPDGELTPDAILAVTHEELRGAGLSNAKARYLRSLAELVSSGELNLGRLMELDDETVIQQLTRVKGVGRWTAEMVLLFSLGRPDVLSVGDLGIRTAVKRHYGLAELPTPAELHAIAESWHPYCSTALLLLWRSLDNAPAAGRGGALSDA